MVSVPPREPRHATADGYKGRGVVDGDETDCARWTRVTRLPARSPKVHATDDTVVKNNQNTTLTKPAATSLPRGRPQE